MKLLVLLCSRNRKWNNSLFPSHFFPARLISWWETDRWAAVPPVVPFSVPSLRVAAVLQQITSHSTTNHFLFRFLLFFLFCIPYFLHSGSRRKSCTYPWPCGLWLYLSILWCLFQPGCVKSDLHKNHRFINPRCDWRMKDNDRSLYSQTFYCLSFFYYLFLPFSIFFYYLLSWMEKHN